MEQTIPELINERMTIIMSELDAINGLLTPANQPQNAPGQVQLTYTFEGKDGSKLECVTPLTQASSTAALSLISEWTSPPPAPPEDDHDVEILDAIEISTNLEQINVLFQMLIGLGRERYERYIDQLNDKAYFLGFIPNTALHRYVDPRPQPPADQPAKEPVHFPAKPAPKTEALSEGFLGSDNQPIDVSTIIARLEGINGLNRTLNYLRKVREEDEKRQERGEARRVEDRTIAAHIAHLSVKGRELGFVIEHVEPKLFIPIPVPKGSQPTSPA